MIRFISAADVLPLRSEVLRDGKLLPEACSYLNDEAEGSFHTGYFTDTGLVSIASFHLQSLEGCGKNGYQLRGMATIAAYRGKGLGSKLLNFGMKHLRREKAGYLWCNARKIAVSFYVKLGFKIISEEFEIPGIGPHYKMHVKLK